jgi:hypothetical protein
MADEPGGTAPSPTERSTVAISQEDYDLLQKLKQQTDPEQRTASPKRQKLDDEALQTFVESLATRGIEWMDLDPALRHLLKTDPEARKDFQQVQLTPDQARAYDPSKKEFATIDLSKKRIFSEVDDIISKTPVLEIPEESIKAAMLEYHSQSVIPSFDKLWRTCADFYSNTVLESQYVQLTLDMMSTRLRSLEQSRANRTVLIRGLPAFGYTRSSLEKNVTYFLSKASLDFSCVAAMHTHVVNASSSIMRLELMTEEQRRRLFQAMRTSKQMWRMPNHEAKAKVEQDLSTDERIALQPYYTMLDILQHVAPTGPTGQLQSDRNTLQIWSGAVTPETQGSLLCQVCYLLDHRFARRYVCVVFVAEEFYDQTLARWHEAFSARMSSTLLLIQALQRAVGDRTTVARHSYTKAFDLANIPDPQLHFGYPVIPLSMSTSLATLLEKHPSLPLQGSSGLLATISQVFQDYGVQAEDFGKGTTKGKAPTGSLDSPKKGKGGSKSLDPPKKGKGGSKSNKPWSNWQDRDPDQSKWHSRKDDDNQDGPSGSSWPSKPSPLRATWQSRPTGKGRASTKGNVRGGRSWDLVLCQLCLCALGWNLDCPECGKCDAPVGMNKQSAPVRALWCPGATTDGRICSKLLGFGSCSLCRAHVDYWHSKDPVLTLTPFRMAEIYQVDRFLYDYDVTQLSDEYLRGYTDDIHDKLGDSQPGDFTIEQWVLAWALRVLTKDHKFLPLLQSSALPFEINPSLTEEYLHNAGGVFTKQVNEHFALLDLFVYIFEDHWNNDWESFTEQWELADWTRELPVATAAVVPWDAMVACSLHFTFEDLLAEQLISGEPPPKITQDLFVLLGSSLDCEDSPFDTIRQNFAHWLNHSPQNIEIFMGSNLYTNETLRHLSGFATCFTDVCFWQLSRAYMVHTAKKPKAQHQVPNESLNFLYDRLVPLLSISKQDAQWALTQRHWNNKGNSLEVLLFLFAEEGYHRAFWQTLWVLFMHQHKDVRFPWIVQVL